jgi:hypothetical protein
MSTENLINERRLEIEISGEDMIKSIISYSEEFGINRKDIVVTIDEDYLAILLSMRDPNVAK